MGITPEDIQAQRELLERGERIREAQEQRAERARLRDTFAAAALAGLLSRNHAVGEADHCYAAFRWADEMLRFRDSRNDALDKPSAWATFYPNGSTASVYVGRQPPHAEPLYRNPQPTLTDVERASFVRAIETLEGVEYLEAFSTENDKTAAATLRGLLERMK